VTRAVVLCGLGLWLGAAVVLAEWPRFTRPSLVNRLRRFAVNGSGAPAPAVPPVTVRDALAPAARRVGERLARVFGVSENLAVRLERVHSTADVTAFRLRQLGWSAVGLAGGALAAAALGTPPVVSLLVVLGAPLLAFLLLEQQIAGASQAWQRRVFLELAVVSEQLGMLLSAGYSLSGALNRVASRGHGACAQDLRRVCGRMRQGLAEVDALREWAAVVDVAAVDRLVAVLSLNRETGDLGRLIADEARSVRREAHRELLASIEKRAQQVWVPVTVATLVPGVLFLAVPFVEAMRLFSGA
jgi:tight adherence protein C